MDSVTKSWIEYFEEYCDGETSFEEIGDWACKYCDDQEHVNKVLDEIDIYIEENEIEVE